MFTFSLFSLDKILGATKNKISCFGFNFNRKSTSSLNPKNFRTGNSSGVYYNAKTKFRNPIRFRGLVMRSCHISNFWIGSGNFYGKPSGDSVLHAQVYIFVVSYFNEILYLY